MIQSRDIKKQTLKNDKNYKGCSVLLILMLLLNHIKILVELPESIKHTIFLVQIVFK